MHTQQDTELKFDDFIRVRVPKDLKQRFSRIARQRMKTDSELAREIIVDLVRRKESEVAA